MAVDAAVIIRTASAALFVLLGLAILVVARRSWGAVALGAHLTLIGAGLVVNNVFRVGDGRLIASVALLPPLCIAAVAVMVLLPRPILPRERWLLVPAALVGAAYALALSSAGPDAFSALFGIEGSPSWEPLFAASRSVEFGLRAMALVVFAARAALHPPETQEEWFRYVGLSAVVGVWWVFQTPILLQEPTSLSSFAAEIILVVALSATWLVAAARGRSRIPLLVALVVPALGLASYAYQLLPVTQEALFFDPWGLLGICRLVGWTLLVLAVLKANLLGVPIPRIAEHRGTAAATALAALFIVAQITENFLSAEYGLLMGGIVAGAFLFAANPIERALEGRHARSVPVGDAAVPSPDRARREDAYLRACRLATRDRRLTREEESHLLVLAEELGLTPSRAHELLVQAERDAELA